MIEGTGFDLLQEPDRTCFAMRKALVPRLDGSIPEVRLALIESSRWFGRGENGWNPRWDVDAGWLPIGGREMERRGRVFDCLIGMGWLGSVAQLRMSLN